MSLIVIERLRTGQLRQYVESRFLLGNVGASCLDQPMGGAYYVAYIPVLYSFTKNRREFLNYFVKNVTLDPLPNVREPVTPALQLGVEDFCV
ncbi:MAG: hypothetical protein U0136_07030 [Bdellovibrionota bacterium]